MCGIAGYWGTRPPTKEVIERTLGTMKNRGPDHQAAMSFSIGAHEARLLHSRLSIIDLDPRSNQPFTVGPLSVVFNGEIYNYLELRKNLLDQGIELRTTSDTEVLLHYYRLHGERCVEHFEGMWAFAILDCERGSLYLSRDRFGEKPLYLLKTPDGLYFGSEVKVLRSLADRPLTVNHRHVLRNLAHGYKTLYKTRECFFSEVTELRGGECLTVDSRGVGEPRRYWQPRCQIQQAMTMEEAIEGARHHLLESVRIRLRADVPLAFCLSGGVDSAALVSIAAKEFGSKLETFSIIDEDERYNEKDNIMATVRDVGCTHHLLHLDHGDTLSRLQRLVEYHDAPVATTTYYVHSLISEAVHRGGFRVVFSGTSADELFTGYYDHFLLHLNEMRGHPDHAERLHEWKTHLLPFIRNPILTNPDLYSDNPDFRDHVFDASDELKPYLLREFNEPFTEEFYTGNLLRDRMLNELFHEATPVILHEDDLNSMLYSIENRSPYLDTRLFEFAYSIPARHLMRHGHAKHVLREAVAGILNDEVRLDRRKKGFNASINSLLNFQDKDLRAYLLDPQAAVFDLVDRRKMELLLDMCPMPNHLSKFVFNFINTRIFLEQN